MVSHERSIPYPPHSHDEESAHPGASDPGGRGHDSFTCRGQALTSAFSRPAAPAAEACVRRTGEHESKDEEMPLIPTRQNRSTWKAAMPFIGMLALFVVVIGFLVVIGFMTDLW